MKLAVTRRSAVHRSARVLQMSGMFDVPAATTSEINWQVDLPIEDKPWNVGLIVGPSGVGKSTIARECFGQSLITAFDWPVDKSILDAFPEHLGIKEITGLLSSVGFSSPPAWLRPFHVLSTGEQFRVFVARALAENPQLTVIDEFTSVVDRTVAQIGSAAVAKAVRRSDRKLVAVTCHYDVLDWLQPDWVYQPATGDFQWRFLQRRPEIQVDLMRVEGRQVWPLFKPHHYLSGNLSRSARCFLATINDRPAAFASVGSFPHPKSPGWQEHRFVVLPDFQGVGLGNRLSEYVGSLFAATGRPYRGLTSHPAYIQHRLRSPLWRCYRAPKFSAGGVKTSSRSLSKTNSVDRFVGGFLYVGPANVIDARRFGILKEDQAEALLTRKIRAALKLQG